MLLQLSVSSFFETLVFFFFFFLHPIWSFGTRKCGFLCSTWKRLLWFETLYWVLLLFSIWWTWAKKKKKRDFVKWVFAVFGVDTRYMRLWFELSFCGFSAVARVWKSPKMTYSELCVWARKDETLWTWVLIWELFRCCCCFFFFLLQFDILILTKMGFCELGVHLFLFIQCHFIFIYLFSSVLASGLQKRSDFLNWGFEHTFSDLFLSALWTVWS